MITSMKPKIMVTKKIFGFMLVIMFLLSCTSAKLYTVGGDYGWTIKDESWAEHKKFHVGDSLVFEYDQNINHVAQVSSAFEYDSCNSSSPKVVYNTGYDVVTFKEPGHHYFITSNRFQCRVSGLKYDVFVVNDLSPPIPSPPPPSKVHEPSRPAPPPSPSKNHGPSRQIPPPPPTMNIEPPPPTSPPPPPPSKRGKIYKVGDSKGWSVYNSYYYYRWSKDRQFRVGDTLFFQYNNKLNDVREISDDLDFRSCEPNSTVAVYKTGHDLIKLTKPGVHYFVSLKTGLCQAGIKLRVTVQPSTEDVTLPDVPKRLSPINRCNRWRPWLCIFRPHH